MAAPLVVIVGPTAVGKTAVGIGVARRLGGEILSGDSMQVYRLMDIGTDKPTVEERRGVPHHLIDIVYPHEDFSVADFQRRASMAIADIWGRGRLPLLVGGTGLYISAVIQGYYFPELPADRGLRALLTARAREQGGEELHRELLGIDPDTARRVHPHDLRRLVRALEVYYRTGRSLSSFKREQSGRSPYDLLVLGLIMDRQTIYRWIEKRVDRMLERGLVEEVAGLLGQGYHEKLKPMQGLGYKELAAYLLGRSTLAEAVRLLKRNTRHLAKRQLTWFRRDPRIHWLSLEEDTKVDDVVAKIVRLIAGKWKL